jgi:hypothetical protein
MIELTQEEIDRRVVAWELRRCQRVAIVAEAVVTTPLPEQVGLAILQETALGEALAIAVIRYQAAELDVSAMTVERFQRGDHVEDTLSGKFVGVVRSHTPLDAVWIERPNDDVLRLYSPKFLRRCEGPH